MRNPAVTMKTLVLLTLVCFLQVSVCSVVNTLLKVCCPGIGKICIPFENVHHLETTSKSCKPKAIIVKTVNGKSVCLDPSWVWTKYLLEKSSGNNPSPPECCIKHRVVEVL
ncbi:C-C motif chemokine 22-like [Nerophis ophidion]|uniref:C-C motif chemokine 22-like n=1 Tax=Nerophis ophidion TaxID=159077 RepID=UPI002AE0717B|nr:C-C motif chemokine 22-like [Nerophis ophidion]